MTIIGKVYHFIKKATILVIIVTVLRFIIISYKATNDHIDQRAENPIRVDVEAAKHQPYLFIGGYGRYDTSPMRVILDLHDHIRCGEEDKWIRHFYDTLYNYNLTNTNSSDQKPQSILDDGNRLFTYLLLKHRYHPNKQHSKIECSKVPDILTHMQYIHKLLPNAKFIYLIRDGRQSCLSHLRKLGKSPTQANFVKLMAKWNAVSTQMDEQCEQVGSKYCLRVFYEELVVGTNRTLRAVASFLNISWTDSFLQHEKYWTKVDVSIFSIGLLANRVKKPLYEDSLGADLEKSVVGYNSSQIAQVAPMLKVYGYI